MAAEGVESPAPATPVTAVAAEGAVEGQPAIVQEALVTAAVEPAVAVVSEVASTAPADEAPAMPAVVDAAPEHVSETPVVAEAAPAPSETEPDAITEAIEPEASAAQSLSAPEVESAAAPQAEETAVSAPATPQTADQPIRVTDLGSSLEASGLVMVETDRNKVATVRVEEPVAPVRHPRRPRAVSAPVSNEPLVQVETHK